MVFGIFKRVKRLVQLEFEHKGLFGTLVDFVCLFLSPRAPLDILKLLGKVWNSLGRPRMCLTRAHLSR